MNRLQNRKGFTVIELVICIVILCITATCMLFAPMNNLYWTEEGVLRQLKYEHPAVTAIVATERNMMRYSRITVEEKGGGNRTYILDTNILFNYTFHEDK